MTGAERALARYVTGMGVTSIALLGSVSSGFPKSERIEPTLWVMDKNEALRLMDDEQYICLLFDLDKGWFMAQPEVCAKDVKQIKRHQILDAFY